MSILMGIVIGFGVWFVFRYVLTSFFTVEQNERAVKTVFGRAERLAAVEFAKAGAIRPKIVGDAMQEITSDPDVANAMFEILEMQNMLDNKGKLTLVPPGSDLLNQLIVAGSAK